MIDLLRLVHRDITALYRHVRDDHGVPIVGQWRLEALVELHKRLHEKEYT